MSKRRFMVGIPTNTEQLDYEYKLSVYHEYVRTLFVATETILPVIIPAIYDQRLLNHYLDNMDGFLFTGDESNVHPMHYGVQATKDHEPFDTQRDKVDFYLMKGMVERKIPGIFICRGMQGLNVALGGSLHHAIHELPHKLDHRATPTNDLNERYKAKHSIKIDKESLLFDILQKEKIPVNSLHRQGINRLGTGLKVAAVAPDDTIEAIEFEDKHHFGVATQWHPEVFIENNPISLQIYASFELAVRQYNAYKTKHYSETSVVQPNALRL